LNLGYKSASYTRVPTATKINAPNVRIGIGVNQDGLDTGITESFETGTLKRNP
jgi:hypothetical protein